MLQLTNGLGMRQARGPPWLAVSAPPPSPLATLPAFGFCRLMDANALSCDFDALFRVSRCFCGLSWELLFSGFCRRLCGVL